MYALALIKIPCTIFSYLQYESVFSSWILSWTYVFLTHNSTYLLHFAIHSDFTNTHGVTNLKVCSVVNQGANRSLSSFGVYYSTRCLWTHSAAIVRSLPVQTFSSCAFHFLFSCSSGKWGRCYVSLCHWCFFCSIPGPSCGPS